MINQIATDVLTEMALRLSELGHPTRLSIVKFLVKHGHKGVPVGDIQQQLDIPASTLSHHLSRLMKADLIRQQRESRILYCFPQFETLHAVAKYLMAECCVAE